VGGLSNLAPEQIIGQIYSGNKKDVWSIGTILYTLLAGSGPFVGNTSQELIDNIKEAKYNFPDNFSNEVKDLISKLLKVSPEERISCNKIRKHSWLNNENIEFPTLNSFELIIDQELPLWQKKRTN